MKPDIDPASDTDQAYRYACGWSKETIAQRPLIVREDDGSLWLSITEAQADAIRSGQTMLLQKSQTAPPGDRRHGVQPEPFVGPFTPVMLTCKKLISVVVQVQPHVGHAFTGDRDQVLGTFVSVEELADGRGWFGKVELNDAGKAMFVERKASWVPAGAENRMGRDGHAQPPACTCPSSFIARGEHKPACAWKAAQ